jgi:hypothetical protein
VNAELIVTEHAVELTNLRNSTTKRITEIITSHAQAVVDMQQRLSKEMSSKWETLLDEEKRKVADLSLALQTANQKLGTLEGDTSRLVYETKKKAYEKVKAQFDAGNKEFQKLKGSLKELAGDKDKLERKVSQQESLLTDLRAEVSSLKERHHGLSYQFNDLQAIMKSFPGVAAVIMTENLKENLLGLKALCETQLAQHQKAILEWEESKGELLKLISAREKELKESAEGRQLVLEQLAVVQAEVRLGAEANEALRQEVTGLKHERDSQLLAIATVLKEKHLLEEELVNKATEAVELLNRCEGLRQMNEEVVCMLERVYSSEKEPKESD